MSEPTTAAGRALLHECVLTDWPRDRKGYGIKSIKDETGRYRTRRAHRFAWESDVRSIRQRHAAGEPAAVLAREYGLNPTTAQRIVRGRYWPHV